MWLWNKGDTRLRGQREAKLFYRLLFMFLSSLALHFLQSIQCQENDFAVNTIRDDTAGEERFFYHKFSEILHLNMQMMHYLIKYVPFAYIFRREIWALNKASLRFNLLTYKNQRFFLQGVLDDSLLIHKPENIVNTLQRTTFFAIFLRKKVLCHHS